MNCIIVCVSCLHQHHYPFDEHISQKMHFLPTFYVCIVFFLVLTIRKTNVKYFGVFSNNCKEGAYYSYLFKICFDLWLIIGLQPSISIIFLHILTFLLYLPYIYIYISPYIHLKIKHSLKVIIKHLSWLFIRCTNTKHKIF